MSARGPLDRLRSPLRRRLDRGGSGRPGAAEGDEGVAILMVIMLMLIVATLGVTIMTTVVTQAKSATFSQKNSSTVTAAEAGLQAGLSQVRTAIASGATYGSASLLPCSLNGAVGDSSTLTYTLAIQYFTADPTSMTAAQRTANALTCSSSSGLTVDPSYAVLTSTGAVRAVGATTTTTGDRVLTSIYTFKSTNANTSGGRIYSFAGDFCLQAGSASSGAPVTYVKSSTCSTTDATTKGLQVWQWDDDYRIRLSSTVTSDYSGLCITGGFSGQTAVTLTTCGNKSSTGSQYYAQLFSFQGGSKYQGQNSTNTGYGSTCLWAGSQTTSLNGVALVSEDDGCTFTDKDWASFAPDARVGAGGAGHSTNQLVNYQQFGRCFDVTSQNINASNMILYPCKQDPTGNNGFTWNQQEYYTEPASGSSPKETITVIYSSTTYCLTTPAKGVSPAYPTFSTCTSGAASQQWVRTTKVTGDYTTSYVFTDTYGRCLSVGPIPSGGTWSSVIAATCTGGAEQKWNAPANAVDATTSGTQEVVRGSS